MVNAATDNNVLQGLVNKLYKEEYDCAIALNYKGKEAEVMAWEWVEGSIKYLFLRAKREQTFSS